MNSIRNTVNGLAVTSLLLASNAFGLSTGNLLLQGTVALVNSITITPNANSTTLNIIAGETNKLVASVSESSNNLAGYTIEASSANAGKLVHTVDGTKMTAYTLSYDGASAVTLTGSAQTVKTVSSLVALTTNNSNVNVNVTAYATAPAGTYQDTVTISIVAN